VGCLDPPAQLEQHSGSGPLVGEETDPRGAHVLDRQRPGLRGGQRLQPAGVSLDRREDGELLLLHEVTAAKGTVEPLIGLGRDGDAVQLDVAILQRPVYVLEAGPVVPHEAQEPVVVLEVEHGRVEADRRVAAAGAAFVGADVEVVDEAQIAIDARCRSGGRRRERRRGAR
jgi:hypothetical protein